MHHFLKVIDKNVCLGANFDSERMLDGLFDK